jgi:phosphotriesterase-related protein
MVAVQTVLGTIHPGSLGFCHSHEHLYIAQGRSSEINPALCIDDHAKTLAELQDFREIGGESVVDAQPAGCGRDAEELGRLSAESGVNIVAATGFHKLQFYADGHWIFSYSADELTRVFLSELRQGMYVQCDYAEPKRQCGSRAGFIKVALDRAGVGNAYRKCFSAAIEAAKETGAAVMVHTDRGSSPLAMAEFFHKNSVNMGKLVFCHMDRTEQDIRVHKEICEYGSYIEYDTISRTKYHSDSREIEIVSEMAGAGYEKQILLGLDTTRERLARYGGSPGLKYLKDVFVGQMLASGLRPDAIRRFFHDNPANAFAIRSKPAQ